MHASLLADQNVRTILVGGELKNTTKAIIGVKAVSSLTQLRFNKAFLGIIQAKFFQDTGNIDPFAPR